jgi:hypothetical protein
MNEATMVQCPQFLYMKCPESDLNNNHPTLGSTGDGFQRGIFFEDPNDERLLKSLQKGDVIVKIDRRELLSGTKFSPVFKEKRVWESFNAINMGAVSKSYSVD